jgi:hypothetical protein
VFFHSSRPRFIILAAFPTAKRALGWLITVQTKTGALRHRFSVTQCRFTLFFFLRRGSICFIHRSVS